MKKIIFIFIGIFSIISCTNDILKINDGNVSSTKEINNDHKITETEALEIVNKLFAKTRTNFNHSIDYVLNKNNQKTRNAGVSDTLAYIFNFNNNNGFAVIASDNRVFPLLAFSDTGHFAYEEDENDPIYVNFVSKLDDYLATIDENDTTITIPDDYLSSCSWTIPLLKTSYWHQQMPYSKYVEEEHPGCPVGCVAIAAGQIMINCKERFYYHDSLYRCHAIRKALETQGISSIKTRIVGGNPDSVVYSYETAIDHVARLLYWIGKDLNMRYDPEGSGASSYNARTFIKNLGYDVKESTLKNFSDTAIVNRIDEKRLIYVDGRVMSDTSQGHAWIIDGYGYNCAYPETTIFHCDWGWGGGHNGFYSSNGYYCGDVFSVPEYDFGYMKYFSVKIGL